MKTRAGEGLGFASTHLPRFPLPFPSQDKLGSGQGQAVACVLSVFVSPLLSLAAVLLNVAVLVAFAALARCRRSLPAPPLPFQSHSQPQGAAGQVRKVLDGGLPGEPRRLRRPPVRPQPRPRLRPRLLLLRARTLPVHPPPPPPPPPLPPEVDARMVWAGWRKTTRCGRGSSSSYAGAGPSSSSSTTPSSGS